MEICKEGAMAKVDILPIHGNRALNPVLPTLLKAFWVYRETFGNL
jgi:hypothetical protein